MTVNGPDMMENRPSYVWDYDISEQQFSAILAGDLVIGRLDQDWAACRLIEYAPYRDIVRMIGCSACCATGRAGERTFARSAGAAAWIFW